MLLDGLPLTDRIRFRFRQSSEDRAGVGRAGSACAAHQRHRLPCTPIASASSVRNSAQIAGRAASHEAKGTPGRQTRQSFSRPRSVPELGQYPPRRRCGLRETQRLEEDALRASSVCIAGPLDHLDVCICAPQVIPEVVRQGPPFVPVLLPIAGLRASKRDERDCQAQSTQGDENGPAPLRVVAF